MGASIEQFRETFFIEAEERLAEMEAELLAWEQSPDNPEPLQAIFRAAHSIKGSAGTFGLDEIARFSHALETMLDRLRNGTLDASTKRIDLLLAACDVLEKLVESTRRGNEPPPRTEEVLGEINRVLGIGMEPKPAVGPAPAASADTHVLRIGFKPGRDLLREGQNPLLLIRELAGLGEVCDLRANVSALPSLDQMDPESCYIAWTLCLKTEKSVDIVREVFEFLDDASSVSVEELNETGNSERLALSIPQQVSATEDARFIKFLIIDDDPDCCLVLSDILSDFGRGHCVYNGAEAMVALRLALEDGTPYDLICLDIMMPQKDGHETLQAIRSLELEHGITGLKRSKIIMTTSLRDSKHCLRSFKEGCENYVVKPVDRDELLGKLREVGLSVL